MIRLRIECDKTNLSLSRIDCVGIDMSFESMIETSGNQIIKLASEDGSLEISHDQDGTITVTGSEWAVSERTNDGVHSVYLDCPNSVRLDLTGSDDYQGDDQGEFDDPTEDQTAEKIRQALEEIDHTNDEHWTRTGLPAMSYIEFFCEDESITREDVNAVSQITRDEELT